MGAHPPCRPPPNSTYLAIGQDVFSISEYAVSQYNHSLHDGSNVPLAEFTPAAVMAYTDIQTLRGLNEPVDYGSGVEFADGVLNSLFPGEQVGLQLGLWLNGTKGCEQINQGLLDHNIEKLVKYLKGCSAMKVFLRIGYEFDNPSFGFSDDPEAYVAAYRRIATACLHNLNSKILLVWHSWAAPHIDGVTLDEFYPGDEVVDWVGVSIFQQFYPWSTASGQLSDIERVLDFAKEHDKPTMIAESTPFGGIDMNTQRVRHYNLTDPWDRWFQPTLDLIDRYDISMWSYINCDWRSQPMWHDSGFGDTRLASDEQVMMKWRRKVLGGARKFLKSGSLLECGRNSDGQFRAVSFDSDRGLIQPRPSRKKRVMLLREEYIFVAVATVVIMSFTSLLLWKRRQRITTEGEKVLLRRDSFGYGSLSFTTEATASPIPMYNAKVRVSGGVRWRDPLED